MALDHLSIVVVDYRCDGLATCVASLLSRSDVETDVTVVDNSGRGDSRQCLGKMVADVRLIESAANVGFARSVNRGLAFATGQWVGLINPDVQVPPNTLGVLVDYLRSHPQNAAVGPALRRRTGEPQPYSFGSDPNPWYVARRALARLIGRDLHAWTDGPTRNVDWLSGACLITRREALAQVGGLDDEFFLYFEDVDWCRRCREAGLLVSIVPSAFAWHDSPAGDVPRRQHYRRSMRRFYRKHYGVVSQGALDALLWLGDRFTPRGSSLPTGKDDVSLK